LSAVVTKLPLSNTGWQATAPQDYKSLFLQAEERLKQEEERRKLAEDDGPRERERRQQIKERSLPSDNFLGIPTPLPQPPLPTFESRNPVSLDHRDDTPP
jgi:hypothetical protein